MIWGLDIYTLHNKVNFIGVLLKITRLWRTSLKAEISCPHNIRIKIVGFYCKHFIYWPSSFIKSLNYINLREINMQACCGKGYFDFKCILSYYVPVQTIVSPGDANCVTPLIYPTTDLDFLFGIIVSFDLSFYFIFFKPAHNLFVNDIIPSLLLPYKACTVQR